MPVENDYLRGLFFQNIFCQLELQPSESFLWEDPVAHTTLRTGFSATIKKFLLSQTFGPWFLGGIHTLAFFFLLLTLDGKVLGSGLLPF